MTKKLIEICLTEILNLKNLMKVFASIEADQKKRVFTKKLFKVNFVKIFEEGTKTKSMLKFLSDKIY